MYRDSHERTVTISMSNKLSKHCFRRYTVEQRQKVGETIIDGDLVIPIQSIVMIATPTALDAILYRIFIITVNSHTTIGDQLCDVTKPLRLSQKWHTAFMMISLAMHKLCVCYYHG
jgi:hypothetical protein